MGEAQAGLPARTDRLGAASSPPSPAPPAPLHGGPRHGPRRGARDGGGAAVGGAGRRARVPAVGRPARRGPAGREPRRRDASPSANRCRPTSGGVRVLDADGERVQDGAAAGRRHRRHGRGCSPTCPMAPTSSATGWCRPTGTRSGAARCSASATCELDAGALGRVADDGRRPRWEVVGGVCRGLAYAGVLLAAGGALSSSASTGAAPSGRRLVRFVRAGCRRRLGGRAPSWPCPCRPRSAPGRARARCSTRGCSATSLPTGSATACCSSPRGCSSWGSGSTARCRPALVGAAVAAGSFAATGPQPGGDDATLATLADVAHLGVAAAWAGGLVLLWRTLRPRRRRRRRGRHGRVVGRFSTLATGGILAGRGRPASRSRGTRCGSLDALTGTELRPVPPRQGGRGRGVAALGAYNHFRLVPALDQGKAKAALARLRTTARARGRWSSSLVLALTSVLVVLTPAEAGRGRAWSSGSCELGDGAARCSSSSPRPGPASTRSTSTPTTPSGRPAEIAESVTLELSLPVGRARADRPRRRRAGPAHFQLDGDDLAVAGTWPITVRARVDRFTEATGTVEVPVAPLSGAADPSAPVPPHAGALLASVAARAGRAPSCSSGAAPGGRRPRRPERLPVGGHRASRRPSRACRPRSAAATPSSSSPSTGATP